MLWEDCKASRATLTTCWLIYRFFQSPSRFALSLSLSQLQNCYYYRVVINALCLCVRSRSRKSEITFAFYLCIRAVAYSLAICAGWRTNIERHTVTREH